MSIEFSFMADGPDIESGTATWRIGNLRTKECPYASFADAHYTNILLGDAYRHGKDDGIEQCKRVILEQRA